MMIKKILVLALALTPLLLVSEALDIHQLKQIATRHNVTCILVFGDSSVDAGNNNRLDTTIKSNFHPYGKDFNNGLPTGRFSDGRLATDFIAEGFGFKNVIPAFLDPKINNEDLLHGVSFASAGSGYDDLTANLSHFIGFETLSEMVEVLFEIVELLPTNIACCRWTFVAVAALECVIKIKTGCRWAFAVVAALEGVIKIMTDQLLELLVHLLVNL
ncbi:hypothetical protein Dsin_021084 [Dipteronia sinensis]|uniref:GDSL esterase/lipase n=1 Tax=Dipteronia sinensis TaxID=43782 RepID=A0AAE0ABM0_9ROSI|nr:hypothetical protein Dsin_021084 [Dipteronia sinensis]